MLTRRRDTPRTPSTPDPVGYDLRLRGVSGNLTVTRDGITAWYIERPVAWEFRSNGERERLIDERNRAWTALAGRTFHTRVTHRPYPASEWARAFTKNYPNPVNKGAFRDYVLRKQTTLRTRHLGAPVVFHGITIGNRDLIAAVRDIVNRGGLTERERVRVERDVSAVTAALSDIADPASQEDVEWLVNRSIGLHLPNPRPAEHAPGEPADAHDLAGVYDDVDVTPLGVGARTVSVTGAAGRSGPEPVTRYVSFLSLGRMEDRRIPETAPPWLAYAQRFGGVEVAAHGVVKPGADAARDVEERIKVIKDLYAEHRAHDVDLPPAVERAHQQAVRTQDEMREAHAEAATRVYVTVRFAVAGATQREAQDRADALAKHLGKQHLGSGRCLNPYATYREFIPGEKRCTTAHLRRLPVRLWAASMPNLTTRIGDRRGIPLGDTVGATSSPFVWDPHWATEHNESGVMPVVGGLGSGKSSFSGEIAALLALCGVQCTVLDPSGALAAITRWPAISDHAKVVNLLNSEAGILSPFSVVPEPTRAQTASDPDVLAALATIPDADRDKYIDQQHRDAVILARRERSALALDVLRGCLPPGLDKHRQTEPVLLAAINEVGGAVTGSLATVMGHLADDKSEHAQTLHRYLTDVSEHPRAALWWSSGYTPSQRASTADAMLVVMTMPGLVLPTGPRDEWGTTERLNVNTLALAANYTTARVYRQARHTRKFVFLDESHFLSEWSSGRALTSRLERDSRKWNLRVLLASQDVATTLLSQKASAALTYDVALGNITDEDDAARGLRLARIPVGVGYEPVLGRLRPPTADEGRPVEQDWRDFVLRINGRHARVRIDLSDTPELAGLLVTTPRADVDDEDDEPAVDDDLVTAGW